MQKHESDAKSVLTHLGELSGFFTGLDSNADKDHSFKVPLEIIQQTMNFDVSVLYRVTNVIENRLILQVVKVLDPKNLRDDLKEGRRLQIFLDNRDKRYENEVMAFSNQRVSHINIPGMGCDIMGYVYLPESFGGAYLFGGDFYGNEASIKDFEVSGVEIMCNFLSAILLKTSFKQQAEYDDLTGMYNSARIKQKVGNILKRFERKPSSNSCIAMGDIDYFKKVNDTYGHIQGDLVLKKVGETLSSSLRGVFDMVGRYGGEEFLLIFDETDEESSFKVIERLRKNIEEIEFEKTDKANEILGDKPLKITMSFGISALTKDMTVKDAPEWIGLADTALYESKQEGRNQTTRYKAK